MWIEQLPARERKGSRPRCLRLLSGPKATVAQRLTQLVAIDGVTVREDHCWIPQGPPAQSAEGRWDLTATAEVRLGESPRFLSESQRKVITQCWLASATGANTPNWDIVTECHVRGTPGLALVEAKAHEGELRGEEKGKSLENGCSENSFQNHLRIGQAITDAAGHLQRATNWRWGISRDTHYQISNRFAWAWKLAEMGFPVVLIYLGFLNAREMPEPFADPNAWHEAVLTHSCRIVPVTAWEQDIHIGGKLVIPRIRSVEIDLLGSPSHENH